mgnify:CR=1 FL=1
MIQGAAACPRTRRDDDPAPTLIAASARPERVASRERIGHAHDAHAPPSAEPARADSERTLAAAEASSNSDKAAAEAPSTSDKAAG